LSAAIRRENWQEYVTGLMRESGAIGPEEKPTIEDIKRFDKARSGKKVSNDEWESPSDPDSRITKMKDGTTHLAYKAEHAVDLQSSLIIAAEIYHADQGDAQTVEDTVQMAQSNLGESGSAVQVEDVAADKGYHSASTMTAIAENTPYRTYVPEPRLPAGQTRTWTDKPPEQRDATYANRRRTRGARGKRLQRLRSERVERTFAHVCETGGARRTWLWGIDKVRKRYAIAAMAHNLSCLMRELFGMGTPRGLQKTVEALAESLCALYLALLATGRTLARLRSKITNLWSLPISKRPARLKSGVWRRGDGKSQFSTAC
jgi:hypothetical protein